MLWNVSGQSKPAVSCFQNSDLSLLDSLFRAERGFFDSLRMHLDDWKVQCLYTKIDRTAEGRPRLETFRLNRDSSFLYLANSVHLPLAALAFQRLQELRFKGIGLSTTMITESAREEQIPAYNDPRWIDGRPTLGRYLCNLLLLHDKNSFNRLYEFLGQEYIMQEFFRSHYDIRYAGRWEEESAETARHANPVHFYDEKPKMFFEIPPRYHSKKCPLFTKSLDPGPASVLSLESLHELLCGIAYADFTECSHRLRIDAEGRDFLMKYISQSAAETEYPLFGKDEKKHPRMAAGIAEYEGVRIFHTGGTEMGQWLESMLVVDTANDIEFALSLAMHPESKTDVKSIEQFLSDLGLVIYDMELNRNRDFFPDLSPFIFDYDK